jgi:hypothetical protein
VLTGASIIGASFLLTSLFTDHRAIRSINASALSVVLPTSVGSVAMRVGRLVGVAGLVFVVGIGLFGPANTEANAAVLLVWAGWWAGYTITVYLLGNSWPAIDPWRALAAAIPERRVREYPPSLGRWPAVAGLLALVFAEVVLPVASAPRVLAALVLGYTAVTLAGAATVGRAAWFRNVDPISGVFREYGRLAPVQRTDAGLSLRLPGGAATDPDAAGGSGGAAFVVALLWVTTFDGLVTTPAWAAVAEGAVGAGLPPLLVYLAAMIVGFAVFLGVYRAVAAWSRRTANTYVTSDFLQGWFAPSLLPIAAGYHLAHFLGYAISLAPGLLATLRQPLTAFTTLPVGIVPGWFGSLQLLFVVVGHLVAVWVAHGRSFQLFTGRLQPLRSQYPFVLVMIAYTAVSMWIVAQPYTAPPSI